MRTREIILMVVSVICLMVFTLFLFDYYIRTEETKVIQKNVYYDSLLLEEQKLLKEKDSIIMGDKKIIDRRLQNHEVRIKRLEHKDIK